MGLIVPKRKMRVKDFHLVFRKFRGQISASLEFGSCIPGLCRLVFCGNNLVEWGRRRLAVDQILDLFIVTNCVCKGNLHHEE